LSGLVCLLLATACDANECGPETPGATELPAAHAPITRRVHVAPDGSDSGDGSSGNPLRSITAALSMLSPGSVLVLADGDYRAQGPVLASGLAGTREAPIRIEGGREALLDSIIIDGGAWLELAGFSVSGSQQLPPDWQDMPAVQRAGLHVPIDRRLDWHSQRKQQVLEEFPGYALFVDHGSNPGSWQSRFSAGVQLNASAHVRVRDLKVELHTACIQLQNGTRQVLLEHNSLSHCLDGVRGHSGSAHAISMQQVTIRGQQISQIFREGIAASSGARGVLIEGNEVVHSGHSHIVTYNAPRDRFVCAGHVVVRHNRLSGGGYYTETMQFPGSSGISLHTCGPGCRAEANRVDLQLDLSGADGNGIIVDFNRQDGAEVVNNVIYRPYGAGVALVESAQVRVLHNTVIEAGLDAVGRPTDWPDNGLGFKLFGAGSVGNQFVNNLTLRHTHGGVLFDGADPAAQARLDYNLYYAPGTPVSGVTSAAGPTLFSSLAQHQAGLGFDLHGLDLDPQLQDLAHGDLRPATDSPAAGAALPGLGVERDAAGRPRRAEAPSIGALEPGQWLFFHGFESIP
jgi:hypothetical protein